MTQAEKYWNLTSSICVTISYPFWISAKAVEKVENHPALPAG